MPARTWIESHDLRAGAIRHCAFFLHPNTHLREICNCFDFICVLHCILCVRVVFSNLILSFFGRSRIVDTAGKIKALDAYNFHILDLAAVSHIMSG